jgi:demethylmenaquinone methyltransferase/2-methoxy-6-polyprenyl-1,4-benzoquinol methylase
MPVHDVASLDGQPPAATRRRFYDRISRVYDLIADASEHRMRERGIRALGIPAGARVLEIGCGTGRGLACLAEAVGRNGHVHGIDISLGMLSIARSWVARHTLQNVALIEGDAAALCYQSETFDAVFMSFTLELFDSTIPLVLAEARRVLRSWGRIGVVALAKPTEANRSVELYRWVHRHWPEAVDCSPIDLLSCLRASGFAAHLADMGEIWKLPVAAAVGIKTPSGR